MIDHISTNSTRPSASLADASLADASLVDAFMPARRLLVVTYHFPPDGSVGGQRWAGLTKNLARMGWTIDVVTAADPGKAAPIAGVTIHHVPRRRTLNDAYNSWARRRRTAQAAGAEPVRAEPAATVATETRPGIVARVRAMVSTSLVFPDDARGWMFRAASAARTLLRKHDYDAMVTSGPPHSAHVAGRMAHIGSTVPWWVDMRDPWAAMPEVAWASSVFDSSMLTALIRRMERSVFARTRRVIANTPEFAAWLRTAYPDHEVAYVPNGIDVDRLPAPATDKFPELSISYAGTLYARRNVSAVVEAIAALTARHPEVRGKVRLRVAGPMEPGHNAQLRADVDRAGLTSDVDILGSLPGAAALSLINRSHVALVLAQDQQMQVPAKLYECMAMGVTTLVIAEETSAAARAARRIGAEVREPNDVEGIAALFERVWLNRDVAVSPTVPIGYDRIALEMNQLLRGGAPGG